MTIKSKTILTVIVCFFVLAAAILYITNQSYRKDIELVSQQAINTARASFVNLEMNDIKMLSSTLEVLLLNEPMQDAFVARDRQKLFELAMPLYEKLKERYAITHFYFIDTPPESKCFLRVHQPELFDDQIKRVTYIKATKSNGFGIGLELGKTAFALRVVHPFYQNGNLIGYLELGEEIEQFLRIIKNQTKDELGLLVTKNKLDKKAWFDMLQREKLPNHWDEMKNNVIIAKTVPDGSVMHYDRDLSNIPNEGMVLQNIKQAGKVFVSGLFPVYDAANDKIGAIFVLHDITAIYNNMKLMQTKIILFVILLGVFILFAIILMLQRLIFARLKSINEAATRIVGGDYNYSIKARNADEIGTFESLFEQFRLVFVNMINQAQNKK